MKNWTEFNCNESLLAFYVANKYPQDIVMVVDLAIIRSLGSGILDYVGDVVDIDDEASQNNCEQADQMMVKMDSMDELRDALLKLKDYAFVATCFINGKAVDNDKIRFHVGAF